jgi:hypothetical protein
LRINPRRGCQLWSPAALRPGNPTSSNVQPAIPNHFQLIEEVTVMDKQTIIDLIRRELPGIMQDDKEMRDWVNELIRHQVPGRSETGSSFDRKIEQLERDRKESARRWDERNRTSDEK